MTENYNQTLMLKGTSRKHLLRSVWNLLWKNINVFVWMQRRLWIFPSTVRYSTLFVIFSVRLAFVWYQTVKMDLPWWCFAIITWRWERADHLCCMGDQKGLKESEETLPFGGHCHGSSWINESVRAGLSESLWCRLPVLPCEMTGRTAVEEPHGSVM